MRARRVEFAPEMAPKTKALMVRIEEELAERIDAYARRLREDTGLDVSQSAAVRRLLIEGLDAVEKPRTKRGG